MVPARLSGFSLASWIAASTAVLADLEGVRAPHVMIDRQGQLEQFVAFNHRAWHAGISSWRGRSGCNDFSIGVN